MSQPTNELLNYWMFPGFFCIRPASLWALWSGTPQVLCPPGKLSSPPVIYKVCRNRLRTRRWRSFPCCPQRLGNRAPPGASAAQRWVGPPDTGVWGSDRARRCSPSRRRDALPQYTQLQCLLCLRSAPRPPGKPSDAPWTAVRCSCQSWGWAVSCPSRSQGCGCASDPPAGQLRCWALPVRDVLLSESPVCDRATLLSGTPRWTSDWNPICRVEDRRHRPPAPSSWKRPFSLCIESQAAKTWPLPPENGAAGRKRLKHF